MNGERVGILLGMFVWHAGRAGGIADRLGQPAVLRELEELADEAVADDVPPRERWAEIADRLRALVQEQWSRTELSVALEAVQERAHELANLPPPQPRRDERPRRRTWY